MNRAWSKWLVPDLALAAAVVTLFYSLFLFNGPQAFFRDSDAGWHIRAGERMLATLQLPRTDPYSFTLAGQPWFCWEWASDVLVGTVYRVAGLGGVALFYAAAISTAVWLWFRLNWCAGGSFLLACVLAAPMLSTTNLHWLARPHVISWSFLLVALLAAESLAKGRVWRLRHWAAAVFVTGLWANMHGSFFLAPLLAIIYATGLFLRPILWNCPRAAEWRRARIFVKLATVTSLATLLNPFGWHLHEHVFRYLTDTDLLSRIGEFQSFNFHADGALQIILTLSLAAGGGVLAVGEKNLPVFLLSLFLLVAALRSARALPLVALALLPLANGVFTRALEDWRDLQPRLRHRLDSFLRYSGRLRALDSACNGLIWLAPVLALSAAALAAPAMAGRTGFPPDQFPVAASDLVDALPSSARLLAPDKFGGYLIYRFDAKRKVFFDGRSDLYGAEFLKQYARLVQVRPGWRQILDSYRFTHALLPNDYSLIPALQQIGWKPLYRDAVDTLLVNPQ